MSVLLASMQQATTATKCWSQAGPLALRGPYFLPETHAAWSGVLCGRLSVATAVRSIVKRGSTHTQCWWTTERCLRHHSVSPAAAAAGFYTGRKQHLSALSDLLLQLWFDADFWHCSARQFLKAWRARLRAPGSDCTKGHTGPQP